MGYVYVHKLLNKKKLSPMPSTPSPLVTSSVDFLLAGTVKLKNVLRRCSVEVDQNAPILLSAPSRRAIASVRHDPFLGTAGVKADMG